MIWRRMILLSFLVVCLAGCSSQPKEELYSHGMAEMKHANPYGAIVYFRNALQKDPQYYEARHELARAYMEAGRTGLAEKEFLKVLAQKPSGVGVRLELAKAYITDRKPEQAIKTIEQFVHSRGDTPESLELEGVAHAAEGDNNAAESNFLKSLKEDPSRTSVKLELATLYVRNRMPGKTVDAKRLVNEVISSDPRNVKAYYLLAQLAISAGDKDKALDIYRKISAIDKSDLVALYQSGFIYAEGHQLDKAEQIAHELVRKFPKRAEGVTLKGIAAFYRKDYRQAILDLQKSIGIQPSPETYYYLGLSHYNAGELDLALYQFRMIGRNDPFSGHARYFTALILGRQHKIDSSIGALRQLVADHPGFARAHYLLGSEYMAKGSFDKGMKELKMAIELDPGMGDAYMKEGIFYLQSGRSKEGKTALEKAIKTSPDLLTARILLAGYYMRQHDYSKATTVIKQGICGKKSDAVLYNNMAIVMYAENKPAEGLKYLQKAKESDPDYKGVYFNLAAFYTARNQSAKALQEYRDILRKDPGNEKALLNMASLLELEGHDAAAYGYYRKAAQAGGGPAYIALADYFQRKKQDNDALSVLDDASKSMPRNMGVLEMKMQILLRDGQFRKAIDVCDDIAAINPERGLLYKVRTYMKMNDAPKAMEQALRFITFNPNSAFGYMMLAGVYESQSDLSRAVTEIKKGIRADMGNPQAALMLGNLYAKMKDYKSAMSVYRGVLQKDPDFPPALFAEGVMLEETGRKKEAIEKYNQALMKSGDYVPALNNLAYLYVNGYGNPQEGLRLAFLGYRQDPSSPECMDTLGYALLKNGRDAEALGLLKKCAALMPGNPTVEYHLAVAFKENGMPDKAVTTLRKSLTSGVFPEASSARKLLAELRK